MKFIDMHCDSLMVNFLNPGTGNAYNAEKAHVDLKRAHEVGQLAQCFAAFLLPWELMGKEQTIGDWEYVEALHKDLTDSVAAHSDIAAMAHNYDEIMANDAAGKFSAIFTVEDGRLVEGKMENIKKLYDMDVRFLNLTWNARNCFGSPNSKDAAIMAEGLTDFGKEAVVYMQELGMLVDVSHLSDGGFWDVANICKKPFVASHSNCRAVCPHQRNLTEDMLRKLAECGGVTGINFGPEFLNADVECPDSTAALMAKMARHMVNVGGIDVVGIGSDFDGIHGNLEIPGCTEMPKLFDALAKEGFSEDEIEKIAYKNALRVFKEAMK